MDSMASVDNIQSRSTSSLSIPGGSPATSSINTSDNRSLSDTLGCKRKHEGDEESSWEPDDGRKYMRIKQRKLRDQFRDLSTRHASSIFEGVTVYVNGWTQPNADELKEMVHAHGGNYEFNLYPNSKVTHTIATNLPNVKIKKLGSCIVCSPAWIVDSIAAGEKLPVDKYLLYSQCDAQQKKLAFEKVQGMDGNDTANVASGNLQMPASPDDISFKHDVNKLECVLNPVQSESTSDKQGHLVPVAKSYHSSRGEQFVSDFFTHSRLHYLSTWSTELKQFTANMLQQVKPRYTKLNSSCSLRSKGQRAVVHIDLDCFFVAVSIRNKPHLKGKPVAVTHAKLSRRNEEGPHIDTENGRFNGNETSPSKDFLPKHLLDSTSDIASCSYAARDVGVHNGMVVGEAMKLCPGIILLPYDFENYRKVSQEFYETLLHYSSCVEAVSCDEAYIEFTEYVQDFKQVEEIVLELRVEIESKTGCTVSAGISGNMLLARMSTRVAKPNGQSYLPLDQAEDFLGTQSVGQLPGVGYHTTQKLKEMGVSTCSQLHSVPLEKLQVLFGVKTGKILYEHARGIDSRELKTNTERKSVSVDINYGIRFSEISEAESLIGNLATELEKRATDAQVLGGTVILKMKVRRQTAPKETRKYLGHGSCDNVTRSFALLQPTRSAVELTRLASRLLKQIRPDPSDIRGMGLQLSKLVSTSPNSSSGHSSTMGVDLRTFLKPNSANEVTRKVSSAGGSLDSINLHPLQEIDRESTNTDHHATPTLEAMYPTTNGASSATITSGASKMAGTSDITDESFVIDLPPVSQLDSSVLEALPFYLREKILNEYANKEKKYDSLHEYEPLTSAVTTAPFEQDHSLSTLQDEVKVHVDKDKNKQDFQNPSSDSWNSSMILITNDPIVIDNEEVFLKEVRAYVRDWILNFLEGPTIEDVHIVSEYLLKLADSNVNVASLALKSMRRFIDELELLSWFSVFNQLLSDVQLRVTSVYGGQLLINSL